jgi:hypothetical protein
VIRPTEASRSTADKFKGILQNKYFKKDTGAVVNLIETRSSAPTAVFMFHSTFVMNYLTWNTLVCAYPKMTVRGRGLLNSDADEQSPRTMSCLIKYILRGFDNMERDEEWDSTHVCNRSSYCPRTLRRINDRGTMCATFSDDEGVAPDLVDASVVWRLGSIGPCKATGSAPPLSGFVGASSFAASGEYTCTYVPRPRLTVHLPVSDRSRGTSAVQEA